MIQSCTKRGIMNESSDLLNVFKARTHCESQLHIFRHHKLKTILFSHRKLRQYLSYELHDVAFFVAP